MSESFVIGCRLRAFVRARCQHWHIKRERIPAAFITGLEADFMSQVDKRVMAELNPPPKPPALPRPRKAKVLKRALKDQPTLL
jgi:hypothetical protein